MTVYRRHNAQAKLVRAQRVAAEQSVAHEDTTHHAAIAGRVKLTLTTVAQGAPMVSDSDETKPVDANAEAEKQNDPRARDEAADKVAADAALVDHAKAAEAVKDKPKGVVKPKEDDEEPVTAHDKPHPHNAPHDKDAKHKK